MQPEQLTRLNPKISSWAVAPGGATVWTPEEISAVLAGKWGGKPLDRACLEIAYASICGREESRDWVAGWFLGLVKGMEYDEGWNESHEHHIALAKICFGVVLPKPCRECRGRGWLPNARGIREPCPACEGDGRRKKTVAQKAAKVGCSDRTWYRLWRHREAKVLHEYTWRETRVHNRLREAKIS